MPAEPVLIAWPRPAAPPGPATLVSVVIPTYRRPQLLARALRSAFAQTHTALEVVVVIDGPDDATLDLCASLGDPRLRTCALPAPVGGAAARNTGVQIARGSWIAFLDDDDAWLPTKLERQLACAQAAAPTRPVVACQIIGRYPRQDYLWPKRLPGPGEPLCEYLFNRRSFFRGEGQLQTSMLLVPRDLMLRVPFTGGLLKHQDTDWYVRVAARDDFSLLFVEQPLAVWYLGEHRDSIVRRYNWERSWLWLRSVQPLLTPRAFAGFIATQLAGEAAAQHQAIRGGFVLFRHMLRQGSPGLMEFALFFGNLLLGPSARTRLRQLLSRTRTG